MVAMFEFGVSGSFDGCESWGFCGSCCDSLVQLVLGILSIEVEEKAEILSIGGGLFNKCAILSALGPVINIELASLFTFLKHASDFDRGGSEIWISCCSLSAE